MSIVYEKYIASKFRLPKTKPKMIIWFMMQNDIDLTAWLSKTPLLNPNYYRSPIQKEVVKAHLV